MKTNPLLRTTILQVVDNQLGSNDPPETRLTMERLIKEGFSKKKAKELIAYVVVSEIFDVLKKEEAFDPVRYRNALANLPKLPRE